MEEGPPATCKIWYIHHQPQWMNLVIKQLVFHRSTNFNYKSQFLLLKFYVFACFCWSVPSVPISPVWSPLCRPLCPLPPESPPSPSVASKVFFGGWSLGMVKCKKFSFRNMSWFEGNSNVIQVGAMFGAPKNFLIPKQFLLPSHIYTLTSCVFSFDLLRLNPILRRGTL